MNDDDDKSGSVPQIPASKRGKAGRAVLNTLGAVPFAGGLFSAAAGYWGEQEEQKANEFLRSWIEMVHDEIREKEQTIVEIMSRVDMHNEEIGKRITSESFQSLLKKSFREWPAAESETKRQLLRNLLSNAASSRVSSDDVVRLFIDWLSTYSPFHFEVIAAIYNSDGISRGEIWEKVGRESVPESSADADLFKLLIRDLSMGSIIRQHRETDYKGNFIKKAPKKRGGPGTATVSAFDREEGYELTALGQQFVHYAMSELSLKINYRPE
ncbi:hypothetical protein [Sulfitobacter sabulilitoris]|uniref:DUF4393 domain-containing protein n=1 Tax=Sulfitobacter sabulilitoris TaxID=2562655 RepID=A0A5S3PGU8_9RHOB|nr:hypothetical protein [Sulfitobacter sabulilitoris]TMM50872.1 hypothetical protein FDT80_16595 [Sulfitobacter sabulilitoris]